MRKSYGAFKSVDDLRAVRGIGEKRLAKMKKYLRVGKAGAVKKAGSAQASSTPVKTPTAKLPPAKVPVAPKSVPEAAANEDEEP
jgi:hypothetical protein